MIAQGAFDLVDGEWYSENTTVRYTYGIMLGGGKFRTTRLKQGTNPDSLIMLGHGDAIVRDTAYHLVLFMYAGKKPDKVQVDLPTNTPMTKVFDGSNVPGAEYRLELIDVSVTLWFLWFNVTMNGPPGEWRCGAESTAPCSPADPRTRCEPR